VRAATSLNVSTRYAPALLAIEGNIGRKTSLMGPTARSSLRLPIKRSKLPFPHGLYLSQSVVNAENKVRRKKTKSVGHLSHREIQLLGPVRSSASRPRRREARLQPPTQRGLSLPLNPCRKADERKHDPPQVTARRRRQRLRKAFVGCVSEAMTAVDMVKAT